MFGATIIGSLGFKFMLTRLNKELALREAEPEVEEQDSADEKLKLSKGFRYLV